MTASLARALMILAVRGLGEARRDWAQAMWAEYQVAAAEGKALGFAAGCLLASCREVPRHGEGRLAVIRHAVALCILVPLACLHIAYALGLTGLGAAGGPWAIDHHNAMLVAVRAAATPALLILWLMLIVGHLGFAWALLERDWPGIERSVALVVATIVTLFAFMAILSVSSAAMLLPAAALAVELGIAGAAIWRHAHPLAETA